MRRLICSRSVDDAATLTMRSEQIKLETKWLWSILGVSVEQKQQVASGVVLFTFARHLKQQQQLTATNPETRLEIHER